MLKRLCMPLIIFAITACVALVGFVGFYTQEEEEIKLVIVMYHNIIPNDSRPNKYEVTLSELERDFSYINAKGYQTVTPQMLVEYTQGKRDLPKENVMITFDDGFYNYNRYLPDMLDKYNLNCVVSVVGEYSKFSKNTDAVARYTYMDFDDMKELSENPHIEIANHTYSMHTYKNGTRGADKLRGESLADYRKRLYKDCDKLESKLAQVGIYPICFTYPLGAYSKDSETIIRERGYKVSLICEERGNKLTRNPLSLYKLGRYNRDGIGRSAENIIAKGLR